MRRRLMIMPRMIMVTTGIITTMMITTTITTSIATTITTTITPMLMTTSEPSSQMHQAG